MAEMTYASAKSAAATYVAAAKQAAAWSKTTNNFAGLIDKIGKTITIDGNYMDKLPELDGEDMKAGRTVEEYFMALTLPEAYSNLAAEMAKNNVPHLPTIKEVSYSLSLGREKIPTTVPYNDVERAFNSTSEAAGLLTMITKRLQDSYNLTKYFEKKQLLGNAATKCLAQKSSNPDVYTSIAKPTDTTTAEAWIEQVKKDVESASFAHEGGLNKALIGASPELLLIVSKGVLPTVDVQAMAGAFQEKRLAIPAKVVVVDDFGTITGGTSGKSVFAMLIDPRGIKLHENYNVVRDDPNGAGDAVNFYKHYEHTGFISKYTYMKVYEG